MRPGDDDVPAQRGEGVGDLAPEPRAPARDDGHPAFEEPGGEDGDRRAGLPKSRRGRHPAKSQLSPFS